MPESKLDEMPPLPPAGLESGGGAWAGTPRTIRWFLGTFIAVYALTFFVLAVLKTYYCTHTAEDTALFNNMFWSTLHGRHFYNYQVNRYHLADHASPFIYLILPIYAVAPGVGTLLLLQTLALSLSGIPFFLIVQRWVRPWTALLLTAAFLLHPGIVSQNVNQIHDVQFAIPFILLALYFLERKDFRKFLVSFLLASIVKEMVLPTLMLFGVYAFIRGLRGKWVWFPPLYTVVFGGGYLLIVSLTAGGWRGASYFSAYGQSWGEILRTFFLHPGHVAAEVLQTRKVLYVNYLLQPTAWVLPFFSPVAILALPDVLTNLVGTPYILTVIWCHYSLIVATFLCVAAAGGVRRVSRCFRPWIAPPRMEGILAAAALLLTLLTARAWFRPYEYRPTPRDAVIREIIALIPPAASVLAPREMVAAFSERFRFATLALKSPTGERLWGFDYAIFDLADRRNHLMPLYRDTILAYGRSPEYRLIFQKQSFYVYQREASVTEAPLPLYTPPKIPWARRGGDSLPNRCIWMDAPNSVAIASTNSGAGPCLPTWHCAYTGIRGSDGPVQSVVRSS